MSAQQQVAAEEKRAKIKSNYETIAVLRDRLEARRRDQASGMSRAACIKMIFDVTRKVERQNEELARAVAETRRLQRDVAKLEGRLDRSFKSVEGIILEGARNDGWSRECYRLLTGMHSTCDQLIRAVRETGDTNREVRQLEEQIGRTRV